MKDSLYDLKDGLYWPRAVASSPWQADLQGGPALAALLATLLEGAPTLEPMLTARVTVDILRPTPMKPLKGGALIVRDGRRMQNVAAELTQDGVLVARATSLRIRLGESLPVPMTGVWPGLDEASTRPLVRRDPGRAGLETRLVSGGLLEHGPGVMWARPAVDLYPGHPLSPVAASLQIADHGSALSSILDSRQWTYANMDVAVHFTRAPTSEWILLDARTVTSGLGVGLVNSILADLRGPFARAHQTVFLEPLTGRSAAAAPSEARA